MKKCFEEIFFVQPLVFVIIILTLPHGVASFGNILAMNGIFGANRSRCKLREPPCPLRYPLFA